jgi:hypothetical protein
VDGDVEKLGTAEDFEHEGRGVPHAAELIAALPLAATELIAPDVISLQPLAC